MLPQGPYLGELSNPPSHNTIGYGSAGTVLEAGPKCFLQRDDKVAINLLTPCRRCHACCRDKEYSKCISKSLHTQYTPGMFISLPRALVALLPPPLTLEEGSLIQVLALAVKMVNKADPKPGQGVIVLGVSCLGIIFCLLARARGVRQIMVVDRDDGRLNVARKFVRFLETQSADTVAVMTCVVPEGTDAANGAAAVVQAFGREADVCVNATGEYGLMNVASKTVKSGGVYVHAGVRESEVSWDVLGMWREDITIHGEVCCEDLNYEEAVKMVMLGEVSLREFCPQE
jgi:threonine dehydrogenase-like Zn-dependent dehydrogenase